MPLCYSLAWKSEGTTDNAKGFKAWFKGFRVKVHDVTE